jgi:hypothetical protein
MTVLDRIRLWWARMVVAPPGSDYDRTDRELDQQYLRR